jgi:hypothetical protein
MVTLMMLAVSCRVPMTRTSWDSEFTTVSSPARPFRDSVPLR